MAKPKRGSCFYLKQKRIDRLLKKIQLNFLWMETFQSKCREPYYQKTGQKKMKQIKQWLQTAWHLDPDYVCQQKPQLATFYYVNIEHYESLMIVGFNEKMREHPILRKSLIEKGIDADELLNLFPAEALNVENPFMMIVPGVPNIYGQESLKNFGEYLLQHYNKDLTLLKELTSFVGFVSQ